MTKRFIDYRIPILWQVAVCFVVVCFFGACASSSPPQPPKSVRSKTSDTTLGPGDIFTVTVFGEKDLSGKYRVSAAGKIDYPFVGSVFVSGLTPPKIAKLLKAKLAQGYLKNPHVSVFVDSYNSKKISVFGQVRKPGTFTYMDNMSIIEAITLAGGFTPIASKNKISVTRVDKGISRRFTIPAEKIGEGRASNYLLRAGDIVFVPERIF
jgi:polysaccharide export outer membrane protein